MNCVCAAALGFERTGAVCSDASRRTYRFFISRTDTPHAAQRKRHCLSSHSLTLLEPRAATNNANILRATISVAAITLLFDQSTKTAINQHANVVGNTIEPMSRTNQGK